MLSFWICSQCFDSGLINSGADLEFQYYLAFAESYCFAVASPVHKIEFAAPTGAKPLKRVSFVAGTYPDVQTGN